METAGLSDRRTALGQSALIDGYVVLFCGTGVHLARAIDPAFGKEASFVPVSDPAGHAADGK